MKHLTVKPTNMERGEILSEEDIESAMARDALRVLSDAEDLYRRKNADYGDSWKLTGKTMELWLRHQGVTELTIPANEHVLNSLGLFTRRLDKMIREFNGWFVADELLVNEKIAETHEDDVPYAAMHTELAEAYASMSYEEYANQLDE